MQRGFTTVLASLRRWLLAGIAGAILSACQSAPPTVRESEPQAEPPEQLEQVLGADSNANESAASIEPAPADFPIDATFVEPPPAMDAQQEMVHGRHTEEPSEAAFMEPVRGRPIQGPSEAAYLLPKAKPRPATAGKGVPLPAAEAIAVDINPYSGGTWINAGSQVTWTLRLQSVGASSLSFYFNPIRLPPGSKLTIASPDGSTRHGPYSPTELREREFWTPSVPGESMVLSLSLPHRAQAGLQLNVAQARIGYREE